MKALAGGNLIATARQSFRFVLEVPGMHAVAVGMLSTAEIEANLALLNGEAEDHESWERLEKGRRKLKIMEQFCKGCGLCVTACTNNAIAMADGKARVTEAECILCGYCAAVCPDFIIRVV
jgi:ferredoxin